MLAISLLAPAGLVLLVGAFVRQLWHERKQLAVQKLACAEREIWYRDHVAALLTAARRSPAAVVERMEAAAYRVAPGIEAVLFAEPEDDALVVRYARGLHSGFVSEMRLNPAGKSALAQAVRCGHRVATGSPGVDTLFGEGAYLAVPLLARGHVLGAIAFLATEAVDLDGRHDELVRLTELATPVYELAKERRADVSAAERDGLTGLLTPVIFRKRLSEELAVARRVTAPYSLLFIDTDHFKTCNDTLGHGAGDIVLTTIAQILMSHGADDAIVGRNGGDEFCVGLGCAKSAALRLAESLRRAIADYDFTASIGAALPTAITASIGVATFPDDAVDARALLEAADAAMYLSKRQGRNRVSFMGMPHVHSAA